MIMRDVQEIPAKNLQSLGQKGRWRTDVTRSDGWCPRPGLNQTDAFRESAETFASRIWWFPMSSPQGFSEIARLMIFCKRFSIGHLRKQHRVALRRYGHQTALCIFFACLPQQLKQTYTTQWQPTSVGKTIQTVPKAFGNI